MRVSGEVFIENFEDAAAVAANWSPYGSAFLCLRTESARFCRMVRWFLLGKSPGHNPRQRNDPIRFGDLVYAVDVKLTGSSQNRLCFGSDAEGSAFWVV